MNYDLEFLVMLSLLVLGVYVGVRIVVSVRQAAAALRDIAASLEKIEQEITRRGI